MLQTTSGYPGMVSVSPSIMSLSNAGIVRLPVVYSNDALITQSNYEKAGFQGLGFDIPTSSGLDLTSLFTGSGGTLALIGVGIGIYYLAKALSSESERKRARKRYDKDIQEVAQKYSKYGFGSTRHSRGGGGPPIGL